MSTKRRIYFSSFCLLLVLVITATSMGLIIAALQANVDSGFSITYTPNNINCAIYGSYGSGASFTNMTNGDSEYIYYQGETSDTTNQNFDPLGELALTQDNPSITLRYDFINFSKTPLNVTASLTGEQQNLDVSYTIKKSKSDDQTSSEFPAKFTVECSGYESPEEKVESPSLPASPRSLPLTLAILAQKTFDTGFSSALSDETLTGLLKLISSVSDTPYDLFSSANVIVTLAVIDTYLHYMNSPNVSGADYYLYLQNLFEHLPKSAVFKRVFNGYYYGSSEYALVPEFLTGYFSVANSSIVPNYAEIFMEQLAMSGNHDLSFFETVPYQHYFTTDMWGEVLKDFGVNMYISNVLHAFTHNQQDRAIALAEKVSFWLTDMGLDLLNPEEICNKITSLPDQLKAYKQSGSISSAEAQLKEIETEIYENKSATEKCKKFNALITLLRDSGDSNTQRYLFFKSGIVAHTEIDVTFSIKDTSQEAYLKDGALKFELS